ncbi:MAG: hypothetical protein JWO92_187 [Chitinophagaceae bacterium]|nr:hypothetical protein [Chitinophagaceae bacterium]MDB5223084.1 hypothetical protein [Chitinophagaceae bacterium]
MQGKPIFAITISHMQKIILTAFTFLFLISCNQSVKTKKNSDPLEAGREFINASLTGDYDYAKKYLLADSTNLMYFDRFVEFDEKKPATDKEGYKNSNIIINSTQNISDSVTIINYSNTYKKEPAKVKLIKKNNEWLVDFKYTFLDSL